MLYPSFSQSIYKSTFSVNRPDLSLHFLHNAIFRIVNRSGENGHFSYAALIRKKGGYAPSTSSNEAINGIEGTLSTEQINKVQELMNYTITPPPTGGPFWPAIPIIKGID